MAYRLEDRIDNNVLPAVITPDRVVTQRRGLVGRLLSAIGTWSANRRLDRARRRYRTGIAPPVPDYLREDVGLPPASQRVTSVNPMDYRWK